MRLTIDVETEPRSLASTPLIASAGWQHHGRASPEQERLLGEHGPTICGLEPVENLLGDRGTVDGRDRLTAHLSPPGRNTAPQILASRFFQRRDGPQLNRWIPVIEGSCQRIHGSLIGKIPQGADRDQFDIAALVTCDHVAKRFQSTGAASFAPGDTSRSPHVRIFIGAG